MAPKSPWNKKTHLDTNVQKGAAASDAASSVINYGEAQSEELQALQAIYMEDFKEVAMKGAWSKTIDRAFQLTLRPFSSDLAKPDDFVLLSVRLTATYPKTAPILEVQGIGNFHERTQKRIMNVIRLGPKQMLGGVMIHTLASDIQDALEDAITARSQGALPSLDDERASAEEAALTQAREAKEAAAQRVLEAKEEEERTLQQMVRQVVDRRDKRKSLKREDIPQHDAESDIPDIIEFQQTAKIVVDNDTMSFREVSITSPLSMNGTVRSFLGKPNVANMKRAPLVAVLNRKVEKARSEILELEAVLESAHKLRHPSLVNLFAYRVERINNFNSILYICREYMERGPLHDLLEISSIHIDKARQFTIQLLEGLDYLHHNGLAHGGISTRTIYLCGRPNLSPKLADFGYAGMLGLQGSHLPQGWRSSDVDSTSQSARRRNDIWDLGTIIVQLFLGLDYPQEYSSPVTMLSKINFSEPMEDLLHKLFSTDESKRSSCFDLLPAEFLRTESPVLAENLAKPQQHRTRKSSSGFASPLKRRSRQNSSNIHDAFSRYVKDFTQLGRLGKGGFGEVVQARNKLDGGVYAIKKIKQAPQLLEKVLSEVMLLYRLNHPYVVRYYSTWVEDDLSMVQEEAVSTTDETMSESAGIDFGYASTGGLDFVSSRGLNSVEFGDDDDDDDSSLGEDPFDRGSDNGSGGNHTSTVDESTTASRTNDLRLGRSRSDSHRPHSTLYIQMELCEHRSLRDLIRRKLDEDDCWRIIRQVTEGLAHIHSHGIIHRDLKPDNIFIDSTGNPKIGDFGLATTGWLELSDAHTGSRGQAGIDMTRSVGTALYVAPELQSTSATSYNEKVDMYSLGIMFYEMCHRPFGTAMERIDDIQNIRRKDHTLPTDFRAQGDKAAQGRLVNLLINHKPSERPTSAALLRSDVLPVKIEDETIRQALSGLSDPRSPYHQSLMTALFAHDSVSSQRVKAGAWEAKASRVPEAVERIHLRMIARSCFEKVFKRHGAVEMHRDALFPRSMMYTNQNVVQLLDPTGNLLQLPYDLTLPYAQQLARQTSNLRCTFALGVAYRDTFNGGPPRVNEEADFDIVNTIRDDDTAINDAEAIKAMDELTTELQGFHILHSVSFQINHGWLLDTILEHCRVPAKLHYVVKEVLSRLGIQSWTWTKVRLELRDNGLSDTSLDDLQQFDFRDHLDKVASRVRNLLGSTTVQLKAKLDGALDHLTQVLSYVQKMNIGRKMYIAPLSCVNAKFYRDGIMFQCLLEKKKTSVVIAAGGRYDSLIQSFRGPTDTSIKQGAVGLCVAIDVVVAQMAKSLSPGTKSSFLKESTQNAQLPKRCEVLIVANGTEELRELGIKTVASLWAHDISAELSRDRYQDSNYAFIVNIRHETSSTVRVTNISSDNEDADVPVHSLVSHIQQELRDKGSAKIRQPPLLRSHSSHHEAEKKSDNVQVLMARHGGKKSNKFSIVKEAQQYWSDKLEQAKSAPILAVETRDEVLTLIQHTELGDPESWRKAIQGVQLIERQYAKDIQDMLESWRNDWQAGNGPREVCLYNFRTTTCIYYDLGL